MTKISASDRLKSALAALKGSAPRGGTRLTAAAVCRAANVSRNSLYRYHPEILRTLREPRPRGNVARRSSHAAAADRRELSALRAMLAPPSAAPHVNGTLARQDEFQRLASELRLLLAAIRRPQQGQAMNGALSAPTAVSPTSWTPSSRTASSRRRKSWPPPSTSIRRRTISRAC